MITFRTGDPDEGRRPHRDRDGSPDPDHVDDADHGSKRSSAPDGDEAHPSFLALDRAALGSVTAQLSRHLDRCARCSAYVQRIADPAPAPSPTTARRHLERTTRRSVPRGWTGHRAWIGGLAAAGAAALVLFVLLIGRERPGDRLARNDRAAARPLAADSVGYDTAKGGRAVGVYVRRGQSTFLWNGSESIEPGDTLRLKLVPDGMTQVHVFSESPGSRPHEPGTLALLHRAEIAPDRDSLLDTAWRVDTAGEREILIVVLSRRPLTEPVAAQAAALASRAGEARTGNPRAGDDTWAVRLVLPKRPTGQTGRPRP